MMAIGWVGFAVDRREPAMARVLGVDADRPDPLRACRTDRHVSYAFRALRPDLRNCARQAWASRLPKPRTAAMRWSKSCAGRGRGRVWPCSQL
jgi:hypothetical protein